MSRFKDSADDPAKHTFLTLFLILNLSQFGFVNICPKGNRGLTYLGEVRYIIVFFVLLTVKPDYGTSTAPKHFCDMLRTKGYGAVGHQGSQVGSVQSLVQSIFIYSVSLNSMLKIT